jgi:hypothetical protein
MPPPSSSPYDTIHEDRALYKTKPHSDSTDQFFAQMRNLKSPLGTTSEMSAPAQHAKLSHTKKMVKCIIEKLLVRPHDLIFMKEHVPEKFVFGKPFFMNAQLSKRPFPLRRLYNWYMMAGSFSVTNITFEIPGNTFYSGARIRSIDFQDL